MQLYHCSLCKANQIKYLSTLPENPRKDFKITKKVTIALCLFICEKKGYSFLCERWEPELQMQPRCRIMALSICPSNEGLFLDLGSVCLWMAIPKYCNNTHKPVFRALLHSLSTSKFEEAAHQKVQDVHSPCREIPAHAPVHHLV